MDELPPRRSVEFAIRVRSRPGAGDPALLRRLGETIRQEPVVDAQAQLVRRDRSIAATFSVDAESAADAAVIAASAFGRALARAGGAAAIAKLVVDEVQVQEQGDAAGGT